eukprot:TRINITY_DN1702_c0_g1_i2.p1 TRINITY_DN1702_c0_g1~~TRINITY_DN1702_c0_g1_i2.p1  ORF type:complete len:374 (-),score=126.83 TRINITY_DN1702_c0_g1_i2:402-1523(-)
MSQPAQNLSSELWSKPDKQGELKKQGHLVKNWKSRWFVIQHDMLFYFKQKGDARPQGVVPLRSCFVKQVPAGGRGGAKAHCLELSSTRINKVFLMQASSAAELADWLAAIEAAADYSRVSAPYNVQHEIHVDFDSSTGFSGLPPEWETMLKSSGISRDEAIANPDETLQVLEFTSHYQAVGLDKQPSGSAATTAILAKSASAAGPSDASTLGRTGAAPATAPAVTAAAGSPPEEQPQTLAELVKRDDPNLVYSELDKIGEGAAGEVFVATHMPTGKRVAIKKMELNGDNIKLVITEIGMMQTSRHANIVEYLDAYLVGQQLWVAMEYVAGGCLTDLLELFEDVRLHEHHIAFIARESLRALSYIHGQLRIHRC